MTDRTVNDMPGVRHSALDDEVAYRLVRALEKEARPIPSVLVEASLRHFRRTVPISQLRAAFDIPWPPTSDEGQAS